MEDEDVFFVKKGLISAAFCPLSCRFFFVKEVDGDPDKHLHQHIPLGYFGSTPPTQQSPGWHYIFRLDRIPIWTFICDDCILGGGGIVPFGYWFVSPSSKIWTKTEPPPFCCISHHCRLPREPGEHLLPQRHPSMHCTYTLTLYAPWRFVQRFFMKFRWFFGCC